MERAVHPHQKLERRQAILETTWALFQVQPYDNIAVSDVARRVGLAKGTLYLYFSSKESLFVAALTQQFEAWFEALDGRLVDVPVGDRRAVAEAITASFTERPGMVRLLSILHTVLEYNLEVEVVRAFKGMLHARVLRSGKLLKARLPFLQDGAAALMQGYALVIGLSALTHPAPLVRAVIDQEDMGLFAVDFAESFTETFTTLLGGLEYDHQASR